MKRNQIKEVLTRFLGENFDRKKESIIFSKLRKKYPEYEFWINLPFGVGCFSMTYFIANEYKLLWEYEKFKEIFQKQIEFSNKKIFKDKKVKKIDKLEWLKNQ